ncbi:MAG: hypothetical protein IT290_01180 [Deltaproteobacteria bacterium]|nr:hypothetical protein [Deltaproteobacteria bacterium]
MSDTPKVERVFQSLRCCECSKPLESLPASYETQVRLYCDSCKPIKDVKENWKPYVGGSGAQVWIVKDNPFKRTY